MDRRAGGCLRARGHSGQYSARRVCDLVERVLHQLLLQVPPAGVRIGTAPAPVCGARPRPVRNCLIDDPASEPRPAQVRTMSTWERSFARHSLNVTNNPFRSDGRIPRKRPGSPVKPEELFYGTAAPSRTLGTHSGGLG